MLEAHVLGPAVERNLKHGLLDVDEADLAKPVF
jgi:hypothetical protein